MTKYVGEPVKITHTATSDLRALLPGDVTAVWVSLFDATGAVVVAETAMTWDAARLRWQYLWSTVGRLAGTYRARVRIEGIDGGSVWEYKRIRLSRNPVPV